MRSSDVELLRLNLSPPFVRSIYLQVDNLLRGSLLQTGTMQLRQDIAGLRDVAPPFRLLPESVA